MIKADKARAGRPRDETFRPSSRSRVLFRTRRRKREALKLFNPSALRVQKPPQNDFSLSTINESRTNNTPQQTMGLMDTVSAVVKFADDYKVRRRQLERSNTQLRIRHTSV